MQELRDIQRNNTNDPRHFATIKGKATTVNSLGTKWAPSSTYGEEVNALYKNLMDFAGVDYPKDNSTNNNSTNAMTIIMTINHQMQLQIQEKLKANQVHQVCQRLLQKISLKQVIKL